MLTHLFTQKQRPSILLALLDIAVGAWVLLNLTVIPIWLYEYPYGHAIVWVALLALVDTRLLLMALALLAPMGLFARDGKTLYALWEILAAFITLANGWAVLRPLLKGFATTRATGSVSLDGSSGLPPASSIASATLQNNAKGPFLEAWPSFVTLALLAYMISTLAAAVAPGSQIFTDAAHWFREPGQPIWNHYTIIVLLAEGAGFTPWREALHLYFAIAVMRFAYRRFAPADMRQLLFLGGAAAFSCSLLGILDYYQMLDLSGYRPNRESLNSLYNSHRLMALSQHSAWFAQYLVLTWPFILLLYPRLKGRWRKMLLVGIAIMAFAALLTLQRAFWIIIGALICGLVVMQWFRGRRELARTLKQNQKFIGVASFVSLGILVITNYLYHNALARRLVTLFEYRDRLDYFQSSFVLLAKSPFGIGLGQHEWIYKIFIPLSADFYQRDHLTAHNYWLHLLVERGALASLAMLILPVGLAILLWKRRIRMSQEDRLTALALSVSLTGIFLYGIFHYIEELRIIQLLIFIELGMLLKILVIYRVNSEDEMDISSIVVKLGSIFCIGIFALITILAQQDFYSSILAP